MSRSASASSSPSPCCDSSPRPGPSATCSTGSATAWPCTADEHSVLPGLPTLDAEALRRSGSSPAAIAAHYDLPAGFFATWLGSGLVYSCARWDADEPGQTLSAAQNAKIDHFASELDI